MVLNAGQLNRPITILEKTSTFSGSGAEQAVWKAISPSTIWAKREDVGGRETIRGGQMVAEIDVRYTIADPHVTLDATMRVRDAGQEFDIVKIARLSKPGEGFEIMAKSLDRKGATAA